MKIMINGQYVWRKEAEELNAKLIAQNEFYRAALEFYANEKSWVPNNSIDDTCPAIEDAGERAQKALKGE